MNSRLLYDDPRLRLVHGDTQKISPSPQVKELNILHTHYKVNPIIKKGVDVYPYMLLATPRNADYGSIFSPVRGKVVELGPRFLRIEVCEATAEDPAPQIPLKSEEVKALFAAEDKEEARIGLQNLGLGFHQIGKECETLILSTLNSEPGIFWAGAILNHDFETFRAGVKMQMLFSKAKTVYLVVPKGRSIPHIADNIIIKEIEAKYPVNMPQLLSREVMQEKNPKNVSVVSIHALWGMGKVYSTGLPLVESIITLGTSEKFENYIIKEGTRVIDLFDHINVELKKDDTIVLGGPVRGESVSLAERGIPKYVRGVFVVHHGSVPELVGHNPCCNCGECDRACPANLVPSTISKYAEFNLYENCKDWHAEYCLECGLCGFTCIMRRPVLQYMRLAKNEAKKIIKTVE